MPKKKPPASSRYYDRYDEMQDLEMMKDPSRWPQWPLLPLKHRREHQLNSPFLRMGLLIESGNQVLPIVYEVNLFDVIGGSVLLETAPKVEYSNLDVLVQDWRVD